MGDVDQLVAQHIVLQQKILAHSLLHEPPLKLDVPLVETGIVKMKVRGLSSLVVRDKHSDASLKWGRLNDGTKGANRTRSLSAPMAGWLLPHIPKGFAGRELWPCSSLVGRLWWT